MSEVKYFIGRTNELRKVPGAEVHYMFYYIRDSNNPAGYESDLSIPCRARLHHVLTGLFYNWDWNDESFKEITYDEFMMLKHIFSSQKEYPIWKQTLDRISQHGTEEAKKWLIDQVKVLVMRKMMKGK